MLNLLTFLFLFICFSQRTDQIAPTDDDDSNRRKRKILEAELAKLQRNKDRRMVRKAMKAGLDPPKLMNMPAPGDKKKSNKGVGKGKSTTRKCATCGAIGHIRTNKACPMYNERYGSGTTTTTTGDKSNLPNASSSMPQLPPHPPTAGVSDTSFL